MGTWHLFSRCIVNYPVCGVDRSIILTGKRQPNLVPGVVDGCYYHGGPADTATTGTMAYFDANVGGAHMLPRWLQTAGYWTGAYGKYLNVYPWSKGDAYISVGWNDWRVMLDDNGLGGAHAGHGVGHVSYSLNVNGSTSNQGTNDTFTTVGADGSGRAYTTATDMSSDKVSAMVRKMLNDGTFKAPGYFHVGFYGVKTDGVVGPAARHAAHNVGASSDPPSFNEANVADKPAWLQAAAPAAYADPGATTTGWRDVQVRKWRTAQAIDEAVRDLVSTLTTLGILESSFIFITTENGNLLGEHRLEAKGVPYEPVTVVPMYVHVPTNTDRANVFLFIVDDPDRATFDKMTYTDGLPTVTHDALISTIDFAPTVLDIARASRHVTRAPDGMSYLPLLTGAMTDANFRSAALSEWVNNPSVSALIPSWHSIRTYDGWRYTEWDALAPHPATTELYDLTADPDEMVNLTANPAHSSTKATLAARLAVLQAA